MGVELLEEKQTPDCVSCLFPGGFNLLFSSLLFCFETLEAHGGRHKASGDGATSSGQEEGPRPAGEPAEERGAEAAEERAATVAAGREGLLGEAAGGAVVRGRGAAGGAAGGGEARGAGGAGAGGSRSHLASRTHTSRVMINDQSS